MKVATTAQLFLAPFAAAAFSCSSIETSTHKYDLSPLAGPHSLLTTLSEGSIVYNTTYTFDLCNPLKRADKDVPASEACPEGTRVCAVQRVRKEGEGKSSVREAVPLAGDLEKYGGVPFVGDVVERDDGFDVTFSGGVFPIDGPRKEQFKKKAVVRFVCDAGVVGNEGEWKGEVDYVNATGTAGFNEADGDSERERQFVNDGAALKFDGFANEGDAVGTLRATWTTKYACKNVRRDTSTAGWGFFTWFIILAFMLTSAYLIFGSWLNYTRYGARGWDLLPHSDAIRDVPYLVQDFTRKVLNTVQSSGSRGGYSAV